MHIFLNNESIYKFLKQKKSWENCQNKLTSFNLLFCQLISKNNANHLIELDEPAQFIDFHVS